VNQGILGPIRNLPGMDVVVDGMPDIGPFEFSATQNEFYAFSRPFYSYFPYLSTIVPSPSYICTPNCTVVDFSGKSTIIFSNVSIQFLEPIQVASSLILNDTTTVILSTISVNSNLTISSSIIYFSPTNSSVIPFNISGCVDISNTIIKITASQNSTGTFAFRLFDSQNSQCSHYSQVTVDVLSTCSILSTSFDGISVVFSLKCDSSDNSWSTLKTLAVALGIGLPLITGTSALVIILYTRTKHKKELEQLRAM